MVSMRNKKNYPQLSSNTPSYLEPCLEASYMIDLDVWDCFGRETPCLITKYMYIHV